MRWEPLILIMNLYLAAKKSIFCVANLRSSPTTTCDWRLDSESFRQQSTLSRIDQRLPGFWSIAVLLFLSLGVGAKAGLAQPQVPEPLKPWVPWVLHDLEYRHCPLLTPGTVEKTGFACAWPGELALSVNSSGGRFSQTWQLLAPDWVVLPGDGKNWPQAVTAGGREVPVISRGGRPAIYLEIGTHAVAGVFQLERPSGQPGRTRVHGPGEPEGR